MSFQQKRTSSENEDNQLNFQLQNQQQEEENTPHIFTSNLSQPEELNSDQFEMNQETVEQIKQSDQKEQDENLDQDYQTNEAENENININQFNQEENLEKDDNQDYQKYNQEQEKQQQDKKNVKKLNINLEDQANQVELPPVFDPFGPLEESDIIIIEVVKPVNQQSTIKKFVTYQIKYSYLDQEPIIVCRRYSEFSVLRKTLQTIFPGYFIPQIPEKQHLNYSEYKMVKFRHKVFNGFLKKIVIFKCFLESQALKIFLDPEQEDCKKTLLNLECPSMAETIQISGKYFSELSD
ncbi:Phox homologous domain [Pseudocohnilembus persalinus]|uniref:Phox homologous domain n=1 Tax=Pseudocohnilembus persalinus TaxID=266149 RepID=A0A0V0R0A6_PSEPJ|nr:Phox homologous domain [Pseudocohnilembus persalinus]|eukprot:KRX07905.1 Phox homologous domain [Pseudocohnilembus persalinus]